MFYSSPGEGKIYKIDITDPNPTNDFIQIQGLERPETFRIYTIPGKEVLSGITSSTKKIDVQHLATGIHFLLLESGASIKFIKH